MKRPFVVLVALAVGLGACGSGTDEAVSGSTSTTTTTTTTLVLPSPVELANRYFEAVRDGDGAAWRSLFSRQATTVQSDGDRGGLFADEDWVEDDFDADGRSSEADFLQFLYAFRAATGHQLEWDCAEVATHQAECTFVVMDVFSRLAELEAKEERIRLTEAGGLIVTMEELTPVDTFTDEDISGWVGEALAYEQWVSDTHPDHYAQLFDAPCCAWDVKLSSDNVVVHEELVAEYVATLEADAGTDRLEPLATAVTVALGSMGPENWMFEIGLDAKGRAGVAYQTIADEGSNRFSLARCKDRNCIEVVTTHLVIDADMSHPEAVTASPSGALVIFLPVSSDSAGLVGSMAVACADLSCSEPEFATTEVLVFDAVLGRAGLMVAAYDVRAGQMGILACADAGCQEGIATTLGSFHGPGVSGLELLPDDRPVMFFGGAAEEGEPGNLVAVCEDDACASVTITNLSAVDAVTYDAFVADYPMHVADFGPDSRMYGCLDEACETWGQSIIEGRSGVRWARIVTDDAGTARPVLVVTEAQTASLFVCDDLECAQPSELKLGVDDFQFARVTMDDTGALFIVCRDSNELVLHVCPSPFDCEG